jgi:hypothetical protein
MPYDPPRQLNPKPPQDPLEIELVYNLRSCGTCQFFWPPDAPQPYGPYPTYDFLSNTPNEATAAEADASFVWIQGTTRPQAFPDPEVMDGCRKAPIMTIGINPNLTAFASGKTGASWCYPSFSSADGTDSWAKYAYYYRYRSIYQEHFALEFIEPFLLPGGRITAPKPGLMKEFPRASDDPAFEIRVQYEGDANVSSLHLPGTPGGPRYVVLVDAGEKFAAGDLLAARLSVPAGHSTDIYAEPISYYTQMLPVLQTFETFLKKQGHADATLRVGEDVGQVDMIACATPHWGPPWLGGNVQSVNTIISNCVHKNAWAMKQLVQTKPAVIFLVGQSSWNMFRQCFGHLLVMKTPLPEFPEDGAYTLLRMTTQQECRLKFSTKIDGHVYELSTRIIITPHFSYDENFIPQFRMSPQTFTIFAKQYPTVVAFLQEDPRLVFQAPAGSFVVAGITKDIPDVMADLKARDPSAAAELMQYFYDSHNMMAVVLEQMYTQGQLAYTSPTSSTAGFLTRGSGPCEFCVNDHWSFPKGCPYGKPDEKKYPIGFLEKVTDAMTNGAQRLRSSK